MDNDDKILITIDVRETNLYNDIVNRDLDNYKDKIEIISENLTLGDIHITYKNLTHIFERKTLQDLQASIQDGRYKEQKARLLSSVSQKYITYIIEGDNIISSSTYERNKSMIQSAYLHTLFRDNVRILYTKNIVETTTLILLISTKIIDTKYSLIGTFSMKKKKIDNIDTKTCFIMQLSQIPMISNVIAKNIYYKYICMANLIKIISDIETNEQQIKELCKIDGIGKEKASSIIKFLFTDLQN